MARSTASPSRTLHIGCWRQMGLSALGWRGLLPGLGSKHRADTCQSCGSVHGPWHQCLHSSACICLARPPAAALHAIAGGRSGRIAFRGGRLRMAASISGMEKGTRWSGGMGSGTYDMEELSVVCLQSLERPFRAEQRSIISSEVYFLHSGFGAKMTYTLIPLTGIPFDGAFLCLCQELIYPDFLTLPGLTPEHSTGLVESGPMLPCHKNAGSLLALEAPHASIMIPHLGHSSSPQLILTQAWHARGVRRWQQCHLLRRRLVQFQHGMVQVWLILDLGVNGADHWSHFCRSCW